MNSNLDQNIYFETFKGLSAEVHIWQLIKDSSGKITSWKLIDANPTALKAWGKNLDDIKGKKTEEIFTNTDPVEQFRPVVERIFSTQKPYVWESFFAGTDQVLQMTSIPVGEYFISTGEDISERKRRERERSDLLAATKVGVWKFDPVKNSLDWDDSMYELYNIEKNQFSGAFDAWSSCLHPDTAASVQQEFRDAIEGKKDFDTTFAIITGRGEKKYIKSRAFVERDPTTGRALFVSGINMDRTSEVVMQERLDQEKSKLLQSSKLATLGEMAAGIAHEINNPLAIINGCTFVLEKRVLSLTKFVENIEKIKKATERITKIVKGLKKFSRANNELAYKRLNLNEVVDECINLMTPKLHHHFVRINNKINKEIEIDGDEIQIEQVLINLISNAIDAVAGKDDAWIEISSVSDDHFDGVVVKDSGLGIEKKSLDSIFDPFYTTKEVGKGTGLGLSISKSIAQGHGGDLEYRLDGGHTAFIFKIPKKNRFSRGA